MTPRASGTAPAAERYPIEASRHALSILRFPDRRTAWVIVLVAELASSVDEAAVRARVASLADGVPVVAAHLVHETWRAGAVPEVRALTGGSPLPPQIDYPFDLAHEPPLRIGRTTDGGALALAAHHAAFDGLSLVAICDHLLGGPVPAAVASPPAGDAGERAPLLGRLLRPADRVAPSRQPPHADTYAAVDVTVAGSHPTARLAEACASAVRARNRALGAPAGKLGISLSVGGPAGVGNVASYRRIDVSPHDDVRALAVAAMASAGEPAEQAAPSRWLRYLEPVVTRFSDTVLVSNLGRHEPAGVGRLVFHPVARGRSAVAFGLAGVSGGPSALTLRARDLTQQDTDDLLRDVAARFAGSDQDPEQGSG